MHILIDGTPFATPAWEAWWMQKGFDSVQKFLSGFVNFWASQLLQDKSSLTAHSKMRQSAQIYLAGVRHGRLRKMLHKWAASPYLRPTKLFSEYEWSYLCKKYREYFLLTLTPFFVYYLVTRLKEEGGAFWCSWKGFPMMWLDFTWTIQIYYREQKGND